MSDHSSRSDDFDRGLKNRRSVLGDAWVDKSTAGANAFNAEFQSFITRFAWNDVWGRPGLDHPTRRLLVLGMTMGLARWEEFELHCGAAIRASQQPNSGVTLVQIKETLMQGAIYCGVPAANTAFKIFVELLKKEGIAVEPAPLTPERRASTHHTFSLPQLRVVLQGAGKGAPLVLSHALGLDVDMWDGLADELAAAGHPVLRYDHRGHGQSAAPPGPYLMEELVADAARVIREWGVGPVVWIGLSMGGMVGQGLGIRHPDLVRGLVLANTTSQYPEAAQASWAQRIRTVETSGMAAVADMVTERYLHEGFRTQHWGQANEVRKKIQRADPRGYAAACHAVAHVDWLSQLQAIKAPTLVIAGALDAGAPPAFGEAIHREIKGSRFVVLEEASHLSVAEQPEQFAGLIQEFLKGIA